MALKTETVARGRGRSRRQAHALFASDQAVKPAARAFVDHLMEELRSVR